MQHALHSGDRRRVRSREMGSSLTSPAGWLSVVGLVGVAVLTYDPYVLGRLSDLLHCSRGFAFGEDEGLGSQR
jgi:hypothetical protein